MKKIFFMLVILVKSNFCLLALDITPNPIISHSKTVYTSTGNAPYLVDDKFNTTSFTVTNNSWIAINIGPGPSKVFFTWNNPAYSWSNVIAAAHSCPGSYSFPVNYTIQTSSNSTNGVNGTWSNSVSVSNNAVTARGHRIDFTGASWIKMNISTGGGSLDEIEVFDVSKNSDDLWFFVGTSISANTYKSTPPTQTFSDLIKASFKGFNPAMVRGGIPCINSGDLATDISKYLDMTRNVKYWAIEMGTNDAWGGSNGNVASFIKNMKVVIDSCKAVGIQPIISRMIGTNQTAATWQVHPDFLKAIDSLTKANNLIEGPDLYAWFTTHPNDLNSDGVHPNAAGAASIQRLWAEKMSSLYPVNGVTTGISPFEQANDDDVALYPNPSRDGNFKISSKSITNGSVIQIYNVLGKLAFSKSVSDSDMQINTALPPGIYLLRIQGTQGLINKKIFVQGF